MPEQRLYPEFRDEYAPTRYPFADSATLVASNTGQSLDPDIFLDASIYPLNAQGGLYISRIDVASRAVQIHIADQLRQIWASATFDPILPPADLPLHDEWGRPAGILVSEADRLARFSTWASGSHDYLPTATPFAVACVIPLPETGVRGLLTAREELFVGDVLLVGDNGVVLRTDPEHANTIRVDIVGDPLFLRKLCTPIDLFETPRLIQTINDCPPDSHGNFNITVGDHYNAETILRVRSSAEGLTIEAVGQTVRQKN